MRGIALRNGGRQEEEAGRQTKVGTHGKGACGREGGTSRDIDTFSDQACTILYEKGLEQ